MEIFFFQEAANKTVVHLNFDLFNFLTESYFP